jgi:hypothetical protein
MSAINSTIAPSLFSLPFRAQLSGCPSSLCFIIPRHGPRRQHSVSPVACVTVTAGTCLPSRGVFTAQLHSNGHRPVVCFEVTAQQRVYTSL